MKNRITAVLLLLTLLTVMLPYGPVAAEGENLPLPGDYFNLWVALCAVGVIGFLVVLYFLMLPVKRGEYERIEKSHKKQESCKNSS